MIDGAALAAVADRCAAAARRFERAGVEYHTGVAALGDATSGQTASAGVRAAAQIIGPETGFNLVAQQLRSLAAATHRFAAAAEAADAALADVDARTRHELASARIADGGIEGAHTLAATALAAADREAVHQDLVDAAEHAAGPPADSTVATGAAALPIGALTTAAAVTASHRIGSALSDHPNAENIGVRLESRLLDFAPHVPIHLPGWRVAVGLCRHADGTAETVVATPEPAPYLRPGFILLDDEQLVGAGIEPELAMLNYAQAHNLSLVAVATSSVSADILQTLTERDVDVFDPLGPTDG
jgi:hypothetical protein